MASEQSEIYQKSVEANRDEKKQKPCSTASGYGSIGNTANN
jgi:hypothetical protein